MMLDDAVPARGFGTSGAFYVSFFVRGLCGYFSLALRFKRLQEVVMHTFFFIPNNLWVDKKCIVVHKVDEHLLTFAVRFLYRIILPVRLQTGTRKLVVNKFTPENV